MDNIQKNRKATLTPALIADMEISAFIKTCQSSNVTVVGLMRTMLDMAIAEVQEKYTAIVVGMAKCYDARAVDNDAERFMESIQSVASLGSLLGMLNAKREFAQYCHSALTPDCFLKGKEEKEEN